MAVAAFPTLKPTNRVWTPGVEPSSTFRSLNGTEYRVLHGNTPLNTALQLDFANLLESDAKLITDHFATAKGVFEVFFLPSSVYDGLAVYNNIQPSGTSWRYVGPPSVSYPAPGVVTVSVQLTAVLN
jgi:hypothetical protein